MEEADALKVFEINKNFSNYLKEKYKIKN